MAVCALASPPLVHTLPAYLSGCFEVRPQLDTPLIQRVDFKEVTALAAVLDASAEREEKVPGATFTQKAGLQQLQLWARLLNPHQKPVDTLRQSGLLDFYPYLARQLTNQSGQEQQQQQQSSPGTSYLNYVSLLNQVVMMGTQLYNDAVTPAHHKYAAHQIALLYQSLNMLQGDTKPIRRLVEARFDEIKTVTESVKPMLSVETSNWLQEVVWVCREEIQVFPPYIHKRISPLIRTLANGPQRCKAH
eukprot:jgi/Chrzof1/3301/Cz12g20050.t1